MDIKKVTLVGFSPTGTTRKVLESIAQGIDVKDVAHLDMTLPREARETMPAFTDELVIIGAPVYGGRLPAEAVKRFKQLKADNTLAVLVVLYGNREFEDALLELKHHAVELGFNPVAGAAFIGEHSFATKDVPIANGRPNSEDLQIAVDFGAKIAEKLQTMDSREAPVTVKIPGRFPYVAAGARPMTVSPVTKEDTCTVCGTCASVCPTAAISINGSVATETERCIRCCACIKSCPTGARVMEDEMIKKIAAWLSQFFTYPKEPRLFGVDV